MSQNICITGANRGIGLGLTQHYLGAGHKVWAVARRPHESKELMALKSDYSTSLEIIKADISSDEEVATMAQQIGSELIDILINNAGAMLDPPGPFATIPLAAFSQTFATNVFGTIRVTQKLLPALERSNRGIIAMISSQMGSLADNTSGGYYAYRSSKAALNMLTRSLAHDYPRIITLSLHPGWVQTEMGGSKAPTSVADSVRGLSQVLADATLADSGHFLDFRKRPLPW